MVCQLLNFHCHSYHTNKVSDLLFLCLSFVIYKLLEYLKLKQSVSYPLFFCRLIFLVLETLDLISS